MVLFHTGEAEVVVVPPTGSDGNTFEPTEKPFNSPRASFAPATQLEISDREVRASVVLLRRAIATGSEKLLLPDTGLVTGCNRTASCDVDFRVCSAESLILTTEGVRKMLFGGDDGELSFAAAACDIVGVVERAVE
jgi:hypothetical protein